MFIDLTLLYIYILCAKNPLLDIMVIHVYRHFFFKFIYLGFSSFFGLTLSPITMCARLQILQEEKKN